MVQDQTTQDQTVQDQTVQDQTVQDQAVQNQTAQDQTILLASPHLEILRDTYQTMNRRLEHYRQLATGTIFGTVALFALINNGVIQWQNSIPPVLPAQWLSRLALCGPLFVLYFLVLVIVFFVLRIIKRASRNFKEVSSIILKIEYRFQVHQPDVYLPADSLFPRDWPHWTPAGGHTAEWEEDIIPLTRHVIWAITFIFTAYFSYQALRLVLAGLSFPCFG
jgi:hypothetical protein